MAVKIYGAIRAESTQRIVLVCYELGITFGLVVVDLVNKEHKSAEWVAKMQPFGQIPVLEDESRFRVFESRAICRYLANKFGDDKVLSIGLKERAIFEQATSVEQNYFHTVMKLPTNEERANEAHKLLNANMLGYETILSKQKYLAGDKVTLAGLLHLPIGYVFEKVGVDAFMSSDTPSVARWWKDILSRAFTNVQKAGPLVHIIYFASDFMGRASSLEFSWVFNKVWSTNPHFCSDA